MARYQDRASELAAEPMRSTGSQPNFWSGPIRSAREIVQNRELLVMLVKRELKARYKDSALGLFWSLGRPLAMLLIYYVALGQFLGAARSIPSFAIFIYTGLTAWGLFSEIVNGSTTAILNNAGLVKKVYLPREIFPLAVTGSALFNFVIQLGILLVATIFAGNFPTGGRWWMFPLSVTVVLVTALAWAMLFSAVTVYLRDLQHLVDIVLMIAFWASPIVYSWQLVSGEVSSPVLQQLYLTNPMTIAIMGFQSTFWVAGDDLPLEGQPGEPIPDNLVQMLFVWLLIGLLMLWVFHYVFSRLQRNFAQEL